MPINASPGATPNHKPRNTYRKSDVDTHPHGGRMVPAVNVKLRYTLAHPNPETYPGGLADLLAAVRGDIAEDQDGNPIDWVTPEWLDAHLINPAATWRNDYSPNSGQYNYSSPGDDAEKILLQLEEWACEHAWENDIQEDARQCFPDLPATSRGEVVSEGRSGGWAIIPALPPLEEWDAVMLMRWRRFEKYARQGADDIPYQMLWLYLMHEANDHLLAVTRARLGVPDVA